MELGKIRSKKGDVTDILIFVIMVFVVGFGLFVLSFSTQSIATGLNNAGLNKTNTTIDAIDKLEDFGVTGIQNGFFFLFIGLAIATFISAFLVRTHPIFLFLYIFFYGLAIFLGTYLANAYDLMRQNPIFSETLQSQTLINVVFENFLPIIVGIGAISMIIVFAKFGSRTGGDRFG